MTGSRPTAPPLHARRTSQACRVAARPQHQCSRQLPVALVRRALAVLRRANTTTTANVHQESGEFNPVGSCVCSVSLCPGDRDVGENPGLKNLGLLELTSLQFKHASGLGRRRSSLRG